MNSRKVHKDKFINLLGARPGRYELLVTYEQVATPEPDEVFKCERCAEPMLPAFDVVQEGFWEDQFSTWFVCVNCNAAVRFDYSFPRVEVSDEGRRKAV